MNQIENTKTTILSMLRHDKENAFWAELEKSTGARFEELSTALGLLIKEHRILIRYNHFVDNKCIYKSRDEFLYAQFMDLLFLHHRQERSVNFYASQLCVTAKYLATIVKGISGKSPKTWIKETVIEDIEHMLCFTQTSIKEISFQFYFSNPSFFGKYFKSQKGMSPKKYRDIYWVSSKIETTKR